LNSIISRRASTPATAGHDSAGKTARALARAGNVAALARDIAQMKEYFIIDLDVKFYFNI
jgi:hypothetical protein